MACVPIQLFGAFLIDFQRTAKRVADLPAILCDQMHFEGGFGPLRNDDVSMPLPHGQDQVGLFN